jgi:hypothetical protein
MKLEAVQKCDQQAEQQAPGSTRRSCHGKPKDCYLVSVTELAYVIVEFGAFMHYSLAAKMD